MTIRQATYEDLPGIARIHKICFPDYLSTKIGGADNGKLLSRFYREFLEDCPELCFVLIDDSNQILGFSVGYYMDRPGHQERYISKNRWTVARRLLWLMLKGDMQAWSKFMLRFRKPVYYIIDHRLDDVPMSEVGDLLSCCVHPDHRGKGYSGMLVDTFLKSMKLQGRKYCLSSTNFDNKGAKGMFTHNGFVPYRKIGNLSFTYVCEL